MQPYLPFMGTAAPMLVGSPTAGLGSKPAPAYSRQPRSTTMERVNVSCNGVKAVFMVHTQTIVCRCPTCTENGQLSRTMSPTEFERHSGMQSSKKWRRSIKVDMGRDSVSLGRWLEQNGYKSSTPAGMTPPVVGPSENNYSSNNNIHNNSQSQPLSQSLSPTVMLMPQPMMDPGSMQPVLMQQQMAAGGLYAPLLNPLNASSPMTHITMPTTVPASVKPRKRRQNGSGAAASSVGNTLTGGAQDEEDLLAADALNLLRHRDSSSDDHEAGSAAPEPGEEVQRESNTPNRAGAAGNAVNQASPASARLSADHYKPASSKDTPRADAQSMSPLMKHRLSNTMAAQTVKAGANGMHNGTPRSGLDFPAGSIKAAPNAAPGSQSPTRSRQEQQGSHTDGIDTGSEDQEPGAGGRTSCMHHQQQKGQPHTTSENSDGQVKRVGEGVITGNLLSNHHHRPSNSHRIGQKHVQLQQQLMAAQAAAQQAGMWQVQQPGFISPVSPMSALPGAAGSDAIAVPWENVQIEGRKRKSGSSTGKKRSGRRSRSDDIDANDVDAEEEEAAGPDAGLNAAEQPNQWQITAQIEQPGSARAETTDGVPRKKKKKARTIAMPMGMAMMGPGYPGVRPFMMHPYMMGPMMAGHPAMLAQQQQMMSAVQQQPNGAAHPMMMPPSMMWGPWGAYPAYGHGMMPGQATPMMGMIPPNFNPFGHRDGTDEGHGAHVVPRAGRQPRTARRDDSHEWGEGVGEVDEEDQDEEEEEDGVGDSRRRNQGALDWDVDNIKEEQYEQDITGHKIRKHMTSALLKHALQPLISGSVEAVGNSPHQLAVTAYCPYAEFKGIVTEIGAK